MQIIKFILSNPITKIVSNIFHYKTIIGFNMFGLYSDHEKIHNKYYKKQTKN